MGFDNRLRKIEDRLGPRSEIVVPIVWRGENDEKAKARIAEVEARGWTAHVIILQRRPAGIAKDVR